MGNSRIKTINPIRITLKRTTKIQIYSYHWKPWNSLTGAYSIQVSYIPEAFNHSLHAQSFLFSQFRNWEDDSHIWNPNKFRLDQKLRKQWTIESVPVSAKSLSDWEVFGVEVAGRSVHVDVHFRLETTSFPCDFRGLELVRCLNPRKLQW